MYKVSTDQIQKFVAVEKTVTTRRCLKNATNMQIFVALGTI